MTVISSDSLRHQQLDLRRSSAGETPNSSNTRISPLCFSHQFLPAISTRPSEGYLSIHSDALNSPACLLYAETSKPCAGFLHAHFARAILSKTNPFDWRLHIANRPWTSFHPVHRQTKPYASLRRGPQNCSAPTISW